jgi:hypothetical protein
VYAWSHGWLLLNNQQSEVFESFDYYDSYFSIDYLTMGTRRESAKILFTVKIPGRRLRDLSVSFLFFTQLGMFYFRSACPTDNTSAAWPVAPEELRHQELPNNLVRSVPQQGSPCCFRFKKSCAK